MKFPLRKRKLLVGIVVVALTLFVLNLFQKEVRAFFYSFSAPIQKVLWQVGDSTSDFFAAVVKTKNLKNELDELKLKNQELLFRFVKSREKENENETLRQALQIGLQKELKLKLAQIIGKDISQDFILIDKGSEDGISKNMPVITQHKVLVGKISEVYDNFSKIMLVSNKENSFDAKIFVLPPKACQPGVDAPGEFAEDISGVVKGQGNFKILFELIPCEKNLSQGDIVITSALGRIFPKGLLVGEIKEVKKSDVEPFQQAEIKPFFDISQTEILFIILDF